MMKESAILYENRGYWVSKERRGFKVWKTGPSHSVLVSTIGFSGEIGLQKAIDEADRRYSNDESKTQRVNSFLVDLQKLYQRHKIYISGCHTNENDCCVFMEELENESDAIGKIKYLEDQGIYWRPR